MKVERSFSINGKVVDFIKTLGNGYALYKQADFKGDKMVAYITRDDKVLFEITMEADGDCCAHISLFDVSPMDDNF